MAEEKVVCIPGEMKKLDSREDGKKLGLRELSTRKVCRGIL